MKLPKSFAKWPSEQQRKWVADELKKVRNRENELVTLLRNLVTDPSFKVLIENDDRPDLIAMK